MLRSAILKGEIEPMAVTSMPASQLAPKGKQEKAEQEMKQYFESKVKLDDDAEAEANTMIMKTDQGLEFVTKKKPQAASPDKPAVDSDKNEPGVSPAKSTKEDAVVTTKNQFGMPRDVFEMYMDLEEKWSIDSLTKRLKERINEHLRFNSINRDNMLKHVDRIAAETRAKTK